MSDFINTIDVLGDDDVVDSIIQRTITEFKDDQVTEIGEYAFRGCESLSVVELPSVVDMKQYAFQGCVSLERVSLPKLATNANINGLFSGCIALSDVYVPVLQYVGWSMFRECYNLEKIDLPCATYIQSLAFAGKDNLNRTKLKALVLRSETLCSLSNTSALDDTQIANGTGYIYVPAALIEDYKVATNWSTFAGQFRALEDYTVDGTITGELDWDKITAMAA